MSGNQTLQDLEGKDWGEPTHDSYLVRTVHALRRKHLAEFTVEDLRIMIGQEVGLEHLLPLALDHLERNPFVSGAHYPGDLLRMAMDVGPEYWQEHPPEARRMSAVAGMALPLLEACDVTDEIKAHLRQLMVAHPWRAA